MTGIWCDIPYNFVNNKTNGKTIKKYGLNIKHYDIHYYTEPRKTGRSRSSVFPMKNKLELMLILVKLKLQNTTIRIVLKIYDEVIGRRPLNLPPLHISTVGLWFNIPEAIGEKINE